MCGDPGEQAAYRRQPIIVVERVGRAGGCEVLATRLLLGKGYHLGPRVNGRSWSTIHGTGNLVGSLILRLPASTIHCSFIDCASRWYVFGNRVVTDG
jgi:hypothetical protein